MNVSEIAVAHILFDRVCIQARHVWLGSQGAFDCLHGAIITMLSIL